MSAQDVSVNLSIRVSDSSKKSYQFCVLFSLYPKHIQEKVCCLNLSSYVNWLLYASFHKACHMHVISGCH